MAWMDSLLQLCCFLWCTTLCYLVSLPVWNYLWLVHHIPDISNIFTFSSGFIFKFHAMASPGLPSSELSCRVSSATCCPTSLGSSLKLQRENQMAPYSCVFTFPRPGLQGWHCRVLLPTWDRILTPLKTLAAIFRIMKELLSRRKYPLGFLLS